MFCSIMNFISPTIFFKMYESLSLFTIACDNRFLEKKNTLITLKMREIYFMQTYHKFLGKAYGVRFVANSFILCI